MNIDGRKIGAGLPPYVVAEISANHNQSLERALEILVAAKQAGADAVKLQTYTADTITIDHDGPEFTIDGGPWSGRTLYDLYQEAHTPWKWHEALFEKGRELDLTVFSSPFDATAIDFLEDLGSPAYKIASFEIVDTPLIERAAKTGKPLIISTGMANEVEINDALTAARSAGAVEICLLHCVSSYPAPATDSNLKTISDLTKKFDVVTGLSDHSLGTAVTIAAVSLGAALIEKHFTLNRADGGPDANFSIEPAELATLCRDTKTAWQAIGDISYNRATSELENVIFRRSLYVVENCREGQAIGYEHVRSIRPGNGLAPKYLPDAIGRRATRDLRRGEPLSWEMFED
ncbi:MAG: pseudaminic acid synthase [Rhodospirillales bacterium]|nr:pseudaminic acid synthase [Rhodospirillales bacterium]